MRELAKVKDDISLLKDLRSNAVLGNDRSAFERRVKEKQDFQFKNRVEARLVEIENRLKRIEERLDKLDG